MTEDREVHPVQDRLNVVAKGIMIIGWDNNGIVYPICNEESHIIIRFIESGMMVPISVAQAERYGVHVPNTPQATPSPSGSPIWSPPRSPIWSSPRTPIWSPLRSSSPNWSPPRSISPRPQPRSPQDSSGGEQK